MKLLFNQDGLIVATDYYESQAYAAREPCCAVRDGHWHLMLPDRSPMLPKLTNAVSAMPMAPLHDPENWFWKLYLTKDIKVILKKSCFVPPVPALPDLGEQYEVSLVVYGFWLPGLKEKPVTLGVATEGGPDVLYSGRLTITRVSPELKGRIIHRLIKEGKMGKGYA